MLSDYLSETLSNSRPGNLEFGRARMALLDIEAGFWSIRRQMDGLLGSRLAGSVLQQAGANGGASFANSLGPAKSDAEMAAFFDSCLMAYQAAGFGAFEIKDAMWPIGRIVVRARDAFEAWMMSRHEQQTENPVCAYTAGVLVGFINVICGRRDVVCVEHRCQARGDEFCEFDLLPAAEVHDQPVVALSPDPSLGRQINLLEMLFERMPMGVAILDADYNIQRFNPTWIEYSKRYAPHNSAPLVPGVNYFDHLPGAEPVVVPLFERVLAGETIRMDALPLELDGITSYWDVVLAPLVEDGAVHGMLNVTIDATEREQLRQNLELRVGARTKELQMLLDVSATANSSLNLDETLLKTLDLVVDLVDASRVGVIFKDERTGEFNPYMLRPEQVVDQGDVARIMPACQSVMDSGETLYIAPDQSRGLAEPGALVPLQIRDRMLGVLVIVGSNQGEFTPTQLALFKSIADQLGIAVENARLFEKAEEVAVTAERNRLARDLHDAVTQTLFSSSMIADVLPKIWERNPEEGRRRLEELRQLTRGALSEMRTLLVELRPAALADTDLDVLIRHQVNAFIARARLQVKFESSCINSPSAESKEAFYRITQEALNNIAKHADASSVWVRLECQGDLAVLIIQDDGAGFDYDAAGSEGLGLGIMRERARNIGARLEVDSRIGEGTRLSVRWQDDNLACRTSSTQSCE